MERKMKVLVVGAMGHIGSFLIEQLVEHNHEVYALTRGNKKPYFESAAWEKVKPIKMSRAELCESNVLDDIKPDAICDLVSFSLDDVKKLVEKINYDTFYLQIGSIWTYENKIYLPVDENHPKNSLARYGREKGLIEDYLLDLSKSKRLRATVVHPGHISAKYWTPVNPQGNDDVNVFRKIVRGEELILPFMGLTTVHHVHAYDLSQIIVAAIEKQDVSNGQAFIAVAEHAMTLKAMAENMYRRFGHEPNIRYVEWEEFVKESTEENVRVSWDHISHSPCCTVEKAKNLLGVSIKYTIDDIMNEYVDYHKIK